MWQAERRLINLQTVKPTDGSLVVVLGGGPVGLLSALERVYSHNNRVLVIEKRQAPSRTQVVALRDEMASFLHNLMSKAQTITSAEKYKSANDLYLKGVRYEKMLRFGKILTFQLIVLERLLRILAEIFKISFEEGTVIAIGENKELIYTQKLSDGSVKDFSKSYNIAIDASGGHLQNMSSGTFKYANLHPRHGTFELQASKEVWEQLKTAPNMLEVPLENVQIKYPDTWGIDRRPITRVFPFKDLDGNLKVYIGTELPFLADGVDFIRWVLGHHRINVVEVHQTSTFYINGLKYYDPGFDEASGTLKIGDALYQPHYLTASGINNAYGVLTDMQLQDKTKSLNELLIRRRVEYYGKVSQMLDHPEKAGKLFFQQ